MRIRPTLVAAALLLVAQGAQAGAREQLQVFTKGLKGLDGRFSQQVFDQRGKLKEASTGRVAVSSPRLFRWEYATPYPQLIVADGKTVWVYDPDLQQASKRPQGLEEANSPLAILLDPARLDREFVVREDADRDGLEWMMLSPRRGESAFKHARLGFAQGGLAKLEYVDALGQRTVIGFGPWKRNPAFARGTFEFVPAKGVDVIGG